MKEQEIQQIADNIRSRIVGGELYFVGKYNPICTASRQAVYIAVKKTQNFQCLTKMT